MGVVTGRSCDVVVGVVPCSVTILFLIADCNLRVIVSLEGVARDVAEDDASDVAEDVARGAVEDVASDVTGNDVAEDVVEDVARGAAEDVASDVTGNDVAEDVAEYTSSIDTGAENITEDVARDVANRESATNSVDDSCSTEHCEASSSLTVLEEQFLLTRYPRR